MYDKDITWRRVQPFLPENNQLKKSNMPKEYFNDFCTVKIHVDHYHVKKPKGVILIFHGVGGNGRLLSFIAVPLARAGYEIICPDLPLYGFTKYNGTITYSDWVRYGVQLAEKYYNSELPLFLFGLSAGGMLAYQVACKSKFVNGLITTCLLDQRIPEVTRETASNPLIGSLSNIFLKAIRKPLGNVKLPMKTVSNMKAIVNNPKLATILMSDSRSSGAKVSISFLYSMLHPEIITEPFEFCKCPVLLAHPKEDHWTDIRLSRLFFDKIKSPKQIVMLEGAGHFPIEEEGLLQLEEEIINFMEKCMLNNS